MFSALVLNEVRRHVDYADVVTVHQSCLAQRSVQLKQQLANQCGLNNGIVATARYFAFALERETVF